MLAKVTIGAINGGLFDYAGKAKMSTEESSKKDGIKESFVLAKSKTGEITTDDIQKALDKIFEKDYAEAIFNEGGITIKIENKYYDPDGNRNIGMEQNG